jgi:phospholipid/cholesterol/gamma-HCH transport system substrate-binding protein
MTQETKLGVFVLLGIAALVTSILLLGNFQFHRTYTLNILFDNISGLPAKAKVKIAGVDIGAVKKIALSGNKAQVQVWIRKDVEIHADTRARIVSTGIIGAKYLELTVGSPSTPLLHDGDTVNGMNPVSLDDIVEKVTQRIDELTKAFTGPAGQNIGENLNATIANLRQVSNSLKVVLADQQDKLVRIVNNVDNFTGDLADISSDNKEDISVAIRDIRNVAEKMDRLLAKIDQGEGTIGKLVSDQQMGQDLKETMVDLKETTKQAKNTLRRLNLIETSWDFRLRRDVKYEVTRFDAGLKVVPRPGKFYYLGGSNLGTTDEGVVSKDPEKMNTIDLLIGRQFGPTELYGGLIRSKGGVGAGIRPFWRSDTWRRLEFTAEAYDFTRETPVSKPKVNAGAKVELTNWAYLGAQWEDLYYASSLNAYFNMLIRDDDIAYILGLIGLSGY